MLLQEKLRAAKSLLDGTRVVTDKGIFWSRPMAWVGGEIANRLGLQVLRAVYLDITHRPSTKRVAPELKEQAKALIDDGMVVIPDFLPQDIFEKIREEYEVAFDPNRETVSRQSDDTVNRSSYKFTPESEAINSAVIRGSRQDACKVTEKLSPTASKHIIENKTIWELVSAAVGKTVKYNPGAYFQREMRADGAIEDTEQNIILHEDVFYPSVKVFYYLNDNTEENGAFVVVPKSHRLDLKRLKHEYLYSIDIARQKNGKSVSHPVHDSGRMQVFGRAYKREELKEVQAIGKANTLIIANTMAFHRRGGSSIDKERQQIRMCFRHVETLHHRLFPLLDSKKARRYLQTDYY